MSEKEKVEKIRRLVESLEHEICECRRVLRGEKVE